MSYLELLPKDILSIVNQYVLSQEKAEHKKYFKFVLKQLVKITECIRIELNMRMTTNDCKETDWESNFGPVYGIRKRWRSSKAYIQKDFFWMLGITNREE